MKKDTLVIGETNFPDFWEFFFLLVENFFLIIFILTTHPHPKPILHISVNNTVLGMISRFYFYFLFFHRTRSESGQDSCPITLQGLIEKVMVLKKSVESTRNVVTDNTHVAEQLWWVVVVVTKINKCLLALILSSKFCPFDLKTVYLKEGSFSYSFTM